jgi:hypothetical protein
LSFKTLLLGAHPLALAKSSQPSNLSHGAMASNPVMPLKWFRFFGSADVSQKHHSGREPEPQAIGDDGYRADPAEPECREPQKAPRQRPLSVSGHQ